MNAKANSTFLNHLSKHQIVDHNTSCLSNYLQLSSGGVSHRFCGTDVPMDLITLSNTVTIKFVTDGLLQRPNYAGTFEQCQ